LLCRGERFFSDGRAINGRGRTKPTPISNCYFSVWFFGLFRIGNKLTQEVEEIFTRSRPFPDWSVFMIGTWLDNNQLNRLDGETPEFVNSPKPVILELGIFFSFQRVTHPVLVVSHNKFFMSSVVTYEIRRAIKLGVNL
jgi:hypothetical protein